MGFSKYENDTFEKWEGWLQRMGRDVLWLRETHHIWTQVSEMVDGNPEIRKPEFFMGWLFDLVSVFVAVGIRRQCDKDKKAITLGRLLEDLANQAPVMSRERFRSLWASDPLDRADKVFDGYAGTGQPHIDADSVRQDLEAVLDRSERLRKYVDRHIAHQDHRGVQEGEVPTTGDAWEVLEEIGALYQKYYLLLTGNSLMNTVPHIQENWKLPFLVPWAPNDGLLDFIRRREAGEIPGMKPPHEF